MMKYGAILCVTLLTACGGGSDKEDTNYNYTTINCNQTITVELTQEDFDSAIEAGEPIEAIAVNETPSGQITITANQCVGVDQNEQRDN